jgi:hypothetical protein
MKRLWLGSVAAALVAGLTGCQTWMGGMTLPSPHYLEHYPQYFPPDPPFPLPRELATQTDPAGIGGGAIVPPGGVPVPPAPPIPVQPGQPPADVVPGTTR